MKALLDTNIVLDVLLERRPHAEKAIEVFDLAETGRITASLCATTVTTIDYILTKSLPETDSRLLLGRMLQLFDVAPVNRFVIDQALASRIPDFEDAVLDQAARHAGIDVIVTRNVRDFAKARTKVCDPAEFLAMLRT